LNFFIGICLDIGIFAYILPAFHVGAVGLLYYLALFLTVFDCTASLPDAPPIFEVEKTANLTPEDAPIDLCTLCCNEKLQEMSFAEFQKIYNDCFKNPPTPAIDFDSAENYNHRRQNDDSLEAVPYGSWENVSSPDEFDFSDAKGLIYINTIQFVFDKEFNDALDKLEVEKGKHLEGSIDKYPSKIFVTESDCIKFCYNTKCLELMIPLTLLYGFEILINAIFKHNVKIINKRTIKRISLKTNLKNQFSQPDEKYVESEEKLLVCKQSQDDDIKVDSDSGSILLNPLI